MNRALAGRRKDGLASPQKGRLGMLDRGALEALAGFARPAMATG